jgi:hypothetical protein
MKISSFLAAYALSAGAMNYASATSLVVAVDNSRSTADSRKETMTACANQFTEIMRIDPKINRVHFITIGAAKNASAKPDMKRVGPRDYEGYMTRDHLVEHFQNKIRSVTTQMAKGKIREDGSSAIWNGIFNDAAPLLGKTIGDAAEPGAVMLVCSDFIENEVVGDVTSERLPTPDAGVLQGVRVYGVGFGLGANASQQNRMRKTWQAVMKTAGATFTPIKSE